MKPRVPLSKAMRVATALTGMTACAAGFLPTAAAHAASSAGRPKIQTGEGKLVRLKVFQGGTVGPETPAPTQPYWLDIFFKASVTKFQVCGWHPGNAYRCTATVNVGNVGTSYIYSDVGGNRYSWDRGQITIAWNGGGAGRNDTCNTNGAYFGAIRAGLSNHESVLLYGANSKPIGNGIPEC